MDRGYAKFELFNQIVDCGSSYVCRIRESSARSDSRSHPDGCRLGSRVLSEAKPNNRIIQKGVLGENI